MNAFEKHQQLAWELSTTNPKATSDENWRRAGRILLQERAEELGRGNPLNSAEQNWVEAELEIRWEEWTCRELRPYLVRRLDADDVSVVEELNIAERTTSLSDVQWRTVVVQDGARDFARGKFRLHSGNCVDPKLLIEGKDSAFFEICAAVTELYDGCILDPNCRTGSEVSTVRRQFQDGFAACFPKGTEGSQIIAWALQLKRRLLLYNERRGLSWIDELHPRLSVGTDWTDVCARLQEAQRDEMILEEQLVAELSSDLRKVLKAVGLSFGGNVEGNACKEQDVSGSFGGGTHEGGRVLAGLTRIR